MPALYVRAFAAVGEPKPHYDCTISEARWHQPDAVHLRFVIAADRFRLRYRFPA